MITWKKISLFKFQYIERINLTQGLSDIDKVLFTTCEAFDITENKLNSMVPKKANKKIGQVIDLMKTEPVGRVRRNIGPYEIIYDPSQITLGQFVELRHFLQDHVRHGHYALASLSKPHGRQYVSDGHPIRADFFLRQPVVNVMASLKFFIERWIAFIKEYDALFGLDKEMYDGGEQSDVFNKDFGWIFSATLVAAHQRITLDQAYGLPIRQALNDLIYLKAKARYEAEQQKKWSEQNKSK